MSSYFVPTKAALALQTFSPADLIADQNFDAWLAARGYDFVAKFSQAFRAGSTGFTYVYYTPPPPLFPTTETDEVKHSQMSYLSSVLTGYGYTVSTVIKGSSGWQFTLTFA